MNTSKIIKGVVGGGRYTVTAPIVKEDYGLYLQIEGIELPETYEVDFSNDEHSGSSVTMIGNSDGVLIPSQFISSGKDVFAFLYHVGVDFGRTVYKFRIPNKLRPDRTDETPTPEEQSVIDQTIAALNDAVEQTAQDKADADVSAQNASADAERAEEARTDAQNYATQAEDSAQVSHDSELASAGYAGDSANSARASAQSAQSASQSAQTASEKADSITGLTATAQTLPEGSSASASYNPQTGVMSFGIPRGKDGTDGDDGYSPTASVSKSGKVATITITDKNGTTSAQVEDGTDGTDGISPTVTITPITGGHRITITDADGEHSADVMDGDDYVLTEQDKQDITDIAEADLTPTILNAFPTDIASGSIASFPDGADDLPLKSLVVNIDPVQDLSNGDPSPENVCPISGWTGAQVVRTGKNLFDVPASVTKSYITFTRDSDGYVTANPNNADSRSWGKDNAQFLVNLAPGNYKFVIKLKTPSASQYSGWEIYSPTGVKIAGSSGGKFQADEVSAFTASTYGTYYIMAKIHSSAARFMVVKDGVDTSNYEPYTGDTYSITFPSEAGTVYGGTLDVTTGKLTVDRAMVDLGTKNWYPSTAAGRTRFRTSITDIERISSPNVRASLLCSNYPTKTANQTYQGTTGISLQQNEADVYVYDAQRESMTTADFKTAMSGVQLAYKLATPIVYDLTPTEVKTLLGVNNIFADTGDTEVEYRADPDLYIQRNMPEVNVDDVQVNGTSIVQDGVANVPIASRSTLGVVKVIGNGVWMVDGEIRTNAATTAQIKQSANSYNVIVPDNQKASTFYGLAKAAGHDERYSTLPVGQYTEDAKSAISGMLGGSVSVSGTTPTIVAKSGIRYVCGEVSTLDITTPSSGIVDVIFTSGATATVLTVTPPTGMTMKWANGFDPTALEANTTYEINILDGIYGAVMAWT